MSNQLSEFLWEIEWKKTIEQDPLARLANAVESINHNASKLGAEIEMPNGQWVEALTPEQTSKIKLPEPKGLSTLEQYRQLETTTAEMKKKLGKMQVEYL